MTRSRDGLHIVRVGAAQHRKRSEANKLAWRRRRGDPYLVWGHAAGLLSEMA